MRDKTREERSGSGRGGMSGRNGKRGKREGGRPDGRERGRKACVAAFSRMWKHHDDAGILRAREFWALAMSSAREDEGCAHDFFSRKRQLRDGKWCMSEPALVVDVVVVVVGIG
ncbi:unnamed protein product, partial [Scytosiphon promiscuus]